MNTGKFANYAKIYKAEIDKLSQAYPGKYSVLELIFLFPNSVWIKHK